MEGLIGRGALLAALVLASIAQAACGNEEPPGEGEAESGLRRGNKPPPTRPDEPPPPEKIDGGGDFAPLSTIKVPQPVGGDIVNQQAAIALGKALFWEQRVGSDGKVACATCHFSAGTDARVKHTIHPGPDKVFDVVAAAPDGDGDPFLGSIPFGVDDRVGSQGVFGSFFEATSDHADADLCTPDYVSLLEFDELGTRQRRVTGRNTPTAIGAAFNRIQFWDGRASGTFNGVDPFGTDTTEEPLGSLIENASLASQSVGPPLNDTEMSCAGREWNGENSIATKLLDAVVLSTQIVHPKDSVLGSRSAWPSNGLRCGGQPCTYRTLMMEAFGAGASKHFESRFSRYWGQAIQAYEATLIPDQTPFDRFLAGDTSAMTQSQKQGWELFKAQDFTKIGQEPQGFCTLCHNGPELTDATVGKAIRNGSLVAPFIGNDLGFHNVGVSTPFRTPDTETLVDWATIDPGRGPFSVTQSPLDFGSFKTPALRNVALTPPYFHDGSSRTIAEVVDFYNRGGNFPGQAAIFPLGFNDVQKAALVDFLENGLTDCRVEKRRAPFDHPSLDVPNGPSLPALGADGLGTCP